MPRNTDTSAATRWHKNQKEIRKKIYFQNPKLCQHCLKPIDFEKHKRQKFCSHTCAAIFNNLKRGYKVNGKYSNKKQIRLCMFCDMPTKSFNKYCSNICCAKYHRKIFIEKWLCGDLIFDKENISNHIRFYLLEQSNNKCSECGWSRVNPTTGKIPLSVHHIDGNSKNNNKDNLVVLCPNCHSLTENYGSLNKGNGRQKRYKLKPS